MRARQAAGRAGGAVARAALAGLCLLLAACGDPQSRATVGTVPQVTDPVPSGEHLYCIANVGHTLVAYDLLARAVLPGTARYLALDPVGPWFADGAGYYLSRVETSGAGANALIRFDPVTTVELARLPFPPNSNPNSLLLLSGAHAGKAWVALRGSTFDNFATAGIAVVELATLGHTATCDLNANTATCARLAPTTGLGWTSPLGFLWDPACNGGGCAYTVVNNFDGTVRDGVLLVLAPDAQGVPQRLDAIPLGRNPQQELVLEATGELWVVNNGGFVHYDSTGEGGTLQVLDTTAFANGTPSGETLATIPVPPAGVDCATLPRPDPGCDPTGIYALNGQTAWVTTYPDDVLRSVNLTTNELEDLNTALPRITGPLFPVTIDPVRAGGEALFAAMGGLGLAKLGELNPTTGALLGDPQLLQAGQAPLSCTEYQVP
jgi:hypothetical protein